MKRILSILLIALTATLSAADPKAKGTPSEAAQTPPSAELQAQAKALTPTQAAKLLETLNKGDQATLEALPGIGEARAAAIKAHRPYKSPLDLLKIEGIGEATVQAILKSAKPAGKGPKAKPADTPKAK